MYSGYSIESMLSLGYSYILTRLFQPWARLVRRPVQIRIMGEFIGGDRLNTGRYNRIDVFKNGVLILGNDVQINDACHIACALSIEIGNNAIIASRVYITDHDHDFSSLNCIINNDKLVCKPVKIGDRVWIGEGVAILKGVCIGDDCIIGAGSIVTKDFPKNSIIAGNPAKIIKTRMN